MTNPVAESPMARPAEPPTFRLFIAGEWVDSESGRTFESRNPANTRDIIGTFQAGSAADVARAVRAAETAGLLWRRTPAPKRGEILYRFGALMAEHKERLSRAMTREMGKVLAEARGDVQEGIDIAFLMAGEGRRMFGETTPSELPDKWAMSIRQPIGVAGIITPWNFPMAIPCWKMMPALVTGQHGRVQARRATRRTARPSSSSSWSRRASRPGTVNLVTGAGGEVGDAIVESPDVAVISFTGNTETGRRIAGRARTPAQAPVDGAGWQERDRRPGRCGPRPRDGRHRLVGLRHDRPALHRGQPGDRRPGRARPAPPAARGARPGAPPRRRPRSRRPTSGPSSTSRPARRSRATWPSGGARASSIVGGDRGRPAATSSTATSSSRRSSPASARWTASPRRRSSGRSCRSSPSTATRRRSPPSTRPATASRRASSPATRTRRSGRCATSRPGIVYVNAGTTGAETHLPFGGIKDTGNGHREAGHAALDTYTEWKSIYVDFSGRLQRAQIDNQPD